ncbi:MAG: NAD(P)(+) transhydrogenase (Re/Si-specific) subunit beta [Elusimicrobia bacterium]|nr:NAD(P)(+) transhydrogenase (Re/Si-specific) subunit beta [Elusimicrobiota bacterium]
MSPQILQFLYLFSAIFFIWGLKSLGSPKTARRGMHMAEIGMLLAIVGTLFHHEIVTYKWIICALVLGSAIGASISIWIPMTAVPQRTAISHAGGALAACLVGVSEYYTHGEHLGMVTMAIIGVEVMLGSLTFTGSIMAATKLQGLIRGVPITYRGQNVFNIGLLGVMISIVVILVFSPGLTSLFYLLAALSLLFGFLLVLPIGAADMPVVIAMLNAYAGLTDAAMGFMILNRIQIITGSLDGSSGLILSVLMCKAMNRPLRNVIFGAFGKISQDASSETDSRKKPIREAAVDDVSIILENARSVVFVPGYGMAVSQAQHRVRELADTLKALNVTVRYAIHPVAGRMPGHMNVLLAEANVPYDELYDMDQINPYFPETDAVIIVGANDVVNPAAKRNPGSPIYGMPIIDAEKAKCVIVCKRSLAPGFAGIDNELYYNENTLMFFGDAKESMQKLTTEMKKLQGAHA